MNVLKQLVPSKWICRRSVRSFMSSCPSFMHSVPNTTIEVQSEDTEVVIALGSNIGDRISNFNKALRSLKESGVDITRHGCLYETEPAYVTDQPHFLNSAVRGVTKLGPRELLRVLKRIEKEMGRTDGIRYGPRLIDLDILFYGKHTVYSDDLTVPHERIWERPFVLAPLIDLLGSSLETDTVASWHSFSKLPGGLFEAWEKLGGESLIGKDGMRRVLPVGNSLWDWSKRTAVMGVLNLTPDSFSDGGKYHTVDNAVAHIHQMISDGADIIDLGAQSTRPMATRISVEEELERLIPVLEASKDITASEGKLLSVDTFYAKVAAEAVRKGAHIVNDVSAGTLDPEMLSAVAGLDVPYIALHMRGDPATMQSADNLQYHDNICGQVASELNLRIRDAESAGIPVWRVIVDPGIGFSKNTEQNLDILMGLGRIRDELAKESLAASRSPLLIGPSRKRFLGTICARPNAIDRDPATVACVTTGILGGANIVRVHNVRHNVDAVKLCDAMRKRNQFVTRPKAFG
ncbi:hypothetical protein Droror1_Dr00019543 [Drosera rotundifolia]